MPVIGTEVKGPEGVTGVAGAGVEDGEAGVEDEEISGAGLFSSSLSEALANILVRRFTFCLKNRGANVK